MPSPYADLISITKFETLYFILFQSNVITYPLLIYHLFSILSRWNHDYKSVLTHLEILTTIFNGKVQNCWMGLMPVLIHETYLNSLQVNAFNQNRGIIRP